MADSTFTGFGCDPRNLRHPACYPAPAQHWANHFDSPHPQTTATSIAANANNGGRPSQPPLNTSRMDLGPMSQQRQSRSQTGGGMAYGYAHDHSQNPLSTTSLSQNNNNHNNVRLFNQRVQPQLHQQHSLPPQPSHEQQQQSFPQQYPDQSFIPNPPMNSPQSSKHEDQSSNQEWDIGGQISEVPQFPNQNMYNPTLDTRAFLPYASASVNMLQQQPHFAAGLAGLDDTYMAMTNEMDGMGVNWHDMTNQYNFRQQHGMPDMSGNNQAFPTSPTDTSLEVRSLSSSDNGWSTVDFHNHYDGSSNDTQAIFNPSQTLHSRTFSDSSYSDPDNQARLSWGSSFIDVSSYLSGSPSSDGVGGFERHELAVARDDAHVKMEKQSSPILSTATTLPIKIKGSKSPQRSPIQKNSPPNRRQPRKNSLKNGVKAPSKRPPPALKVETEKRVGRRKGPLRPEQRKQASEIRKLGACLRCKFLKKTCDKGEPCQGCLPSHARLWQVPCTRIDIKEIAYFMKDWKADFNNEHSLHFTVDNIIEFSKNERSLYISHGYGHVLPVNAREIFVRDEKVFGVDWVETYNDEPTEHSVKTAKMSLGIDGISEELLSQYLDSYIAEGYEDFIHQYFDGTRFITEMMITVYRYYVREPTPVLKKTLKFLLAYNLTQHVTYVEGLGSEEVFTGKIFDRTSRFIGKTVAPVMINFSVKVAMAKLWRELQKEILEELSAMYSSVYSKEKLKNWPTIFMVACVLLAVWEEMQFDCHYRVQDKDEVHRFCSEMESIPVKVVVGLFHAISQKLPSLQEWETRQHHTTLNSNPAICDALTEVRGHVTRHDEYLRSRCDTQFDSSDFDSLSSKFMSKLVIRAPAA